MEYDFTKRSGSGMPPYGRVTSADSTPNYGQPPSLYPRVGVTASHSAAAAHSRNPPLHHAPPPPSNSSGVGIRVSIKPEYRISAPPPLLPQLGEIPRSNFHFDFEFERNVLAEAVKENPNWSKLGIDNLPPKATETSSSSHGSSTDPVVSKYIAAGLSREAVPLAVANYGDNPTKVKEFANGYALLREMGFSSDKVVEALMMYDNDTEKALAYFLNGSS
ncbi:uncharacterized protein LOC127260000 [Andrographis paniculata]|uniref:uncharacterized protein LOC127260000 n=1 Tax=Andrographis paniculata TaxID=175694 RepID=UPI0021E745F7|nr:uncharacterized protein LOC127260000 [Andrographis paniculata]